jgi:hypothetical protein
MDQVRDKRGSAPECIIVGLTSGGLLLFDAGLLSQVTTSPPCHLMRCGAYIDSGSTKF